MSHLMQSYAPPSLSIERGRGAWVWDEQGRRYLDAFGGIAVTALGHSHPDINAVISEQSAKLMHSSNVMRIPAQEQLAERLCAHSGMQRVFFGNSGAEANEAAIKLSRLHAHHTKVAAPIVICFEDGFHGRTLTTLAATGNTAIKKGFAPLDPGFVHLPYGDIDALDAALAQYTAQGESRVVAVMIEAIQGEAGVRLAPEGFLEHLRTRCDQHQALLICDEIQSGIGRTGRWFGYQHSAVLPDVVTIAKALGNGFPIGACLARGAAAAYFTPGSHGSTFGGNPLACAVANTVLDVIERDQLLERNHMLGARMLGRLRERLDPLDLITEVRGRGMMIGVQFAQLPERFNEHCLEHGLLIVKAAHQSVRLLPPYILSDEQADSATERFGDAVIAAIAEVHA